MSSAVSLYTQVVNAGDDTMLADVVRLVEEAQARSAPVQRLADTVRTPSPPSPIPIPIPPHLPRPACVSTGCNENTNGTLHLHIASCEAWCRWRELFMFSTVHR